VQDSLDISYARYARSTIQFVPPEDLVLGLRGRKGLKGTGTNWHRRGSFGYAQDRLFDCAPQASAMHRSARRFAQDDGFVGNCGKGRAGKF
jgi:hypothetical protein